MLRISISENGELTKFIVEGKLMGEEVKEFEDCWQSVTSKNPDSSIQINLAAVSFIDDEGIELLTKMYRQRVIILTNNLLIKAIAKEIQTKINEENKH